MELKELFLQQLDREAISSRKAIERFPEGHNDWKPHARSMELGRLASLSATMPGWVGLMIETDDLDVGAPENGGLRTRVDVTRELLLEQLEEGLARSRAALKATTEEHLMKPWRLTLGEQVLSEDPRFMAIADGALCHLAHHRGQLTVYYRLLEAKVPALYGPSADESF